MSEIIYFDYSKNVKSQLSLTELRNIEKIRILSLNENYLLASILFNLKKYHESEFYLTKCKEIDPFISDIYIYLSELYIKINDFNSHLRILSEASVNIISKNEIDRFNRYLLYLNGRYEEARFSYEESGIDKSENLRDISYYSYILTAIGDFYKCEVILKKFIGVQKLNPETYNTFLYSLIRQSKMNDAVKYGIYSLRIYPNDLKIIKNTVYAIRMSDMSLFDKLKFRLEILIGNIFSISDFKGKL